MMSAFFVPFAQRGGNDVSKNLSPLPISICRHKNIRYLLTESVYCVMMHVNRFGQFGGRGNARLETFRRLPMEKQNRIIDAALTVFGRNGYKKASIGDIAAAADISKGMVFHYFGSKKALYLYLAELCFRLMMEEIEKGSDRNVTDFFDRIRMTADIKMSVMKKHPAILSFLRNMYYDPDREVEDGLKALTSDVENIGSRMVLDGADVSKFKDGVDPRLLFKFLIWASEGFTGSLPPDATAGDFGGFISEFYECLDLMKRFFYRDNN